MRRLPYLLGATALGLALTTVSCTTLGTHVKGGFACKAPQGTCAPMSNIDAQAIAGLGADRSDPMAMSNDSADTPARFMTTGLSGGVPVRTGENVIRVVFPAHTDPSGVFREQAVAHVVSSRSSWTLRPADPPAPGSLDAAIAAAADRHHEAPDKSAETPGSYALSTAPLTLREAAAGLTARAEPQTDAVAAQVVVDVPVGSAGAPSPQALAAARAGHHIGEGMPTAMTGVQRHMRGSGRQRPRARSQSAAKATIPGAATAALNRAVLHRLTLTSHPGETALTPVPSYDATDAARHIRNVASTAGGSPSDQALPQ